MCNIDFHTGQYYIWSCKFKAFLNKPMMLFGNDWTDYLELVKYSQVIDHYLIEHVFISLRFLICVNLTYACPGHISPQNCYIVH